MNQLSIIGFSLILALPYSCTTNKKNIRQKENSIVMELLPEGSYRFEVLDSIKQTPRQTELTWAFGNAFQENPEQLLAYVENVKNNEDGVFPENQYLTELEFKEYMEYLSSTEIELLPSKTELVDIIHSENHVSFNSSGRLELLSYFKYDLSKNTFFIRGCELPFKDSSKIISRDNAFQESWSGYTWHYSDLPEDIEIPSKEDLATFSYKKYEVKVGTLEQSGRTFIIIEGTEVQNGETLVSFNIPMRMKVPNKK